MKSKLFTHIISFLLLALLFVKVTSFHAYTHQNHDEDTIENCTVCNLVAEQQNHYSTIQSQPTIQVFEVIFKKESPLASLTNILSTSLPYTIFGRPPPSAV